MHRTYAKPICLPDLKLIVLEERIRQIIIFKYSLETKCNIFIKMGININPIKK